MITFCVVVQNRWHLFQNCLNSLAQMDLAGDVELNLIDWQSTDHDYANMVLPFPVNFQRYDTDSYINRSLGRNMAAGLSAGQDDDILFFLDADMLVPTSFYRKIKFYVSPSSTYFPVCYSLYEDAAARVGYANNLPNGWWRVSGTGNCGVTRKQFREVHGWNVNIGKTYGDEDTDFHAKIQRRYRIFRSNCHNFFHQWHEPDATAKLSGRRYQTAKRNNT